VMLSLAQAGQSHYRLAGMACAAREREHHDK